MDRNTQFLLDRNASLELQNQSLRKENFRLRLREVWVMLVTGAICIFLGAWMALYLR